MHICYGITKTGQRCKIKLKEGDLYCHHHIHQQSASSQLSLAKLKEYPPNERYQRGFIYIYTLKHLLDKNPTKQDWLTLKKVDGDCKALDPKRLILVKIGLTQGTVQNRLRQWENQCNHRLSVVDPYCELKTDFLTKLFQKLSIADHEKTEYKNYDPRQQGFFTLKSLALVERVIHETLWKRFGRGDVICHGCKKDGKERSIHKEWFLIERKLLGNVFTIIDDCITDIN